MTKSANILFAALFLLPNFSSQAEVPDHPEDFQSWTAEKKEEFVFTQQIVPTAYKGLPSLNRGIWGTFAHAGTLLHPRTLAETITSNGEELPADRRRWKIIHTFGSVATFRFDAAPGSPFTGMFQGGRGLMRFSYAGPPSIVGNVPGAAFKFYANGKESQNFVVMNGLNSQGPYTSVFQNPFTNILPSPTGLIMPLIKKLFERVTVRGQGLNQPVSHLAKIDQQGRSVEAFKAPNRIIFRPTLLDGISPFSKADFRTDLKSVPVGKALYYVWGEIDEEDDAIYMGQIVNTSTFVASSYGDQRLFFRHDATYMDSEKGFEDCSLELQ